MSSEDTQLSEKNNVDTLLRRTLNRLRDPRLVAQFNRDLFSYRDYARSLLVRTIPGAPRLTALHFSSGSNNPGEIRGFADIGKSPGVALKSISKRLGKPVLVLQCGGKKAEGTAPIRDLYTGRSSQWGVYRSALKRLGSPDKHPYVSTFVLSAKLGLMPENKTACPYDLVLKQDSYKRGEARPVDANGTPVRRVRALVAWMKKDPDQARLLRSLKGRTVYFSGQARGEPYYAALERPGGSLWLHRCAPPRVHRSHRGGGSCREAGRRHAPPGSSRRLPQATGARQGRATLRLGESLSGALLERAYFCRETGNTRLYRQRGFLRGGPQWEAARRADHRRRLARATGALQAGH